MLFRDRADAGRQLAEKLRHCCGRDAVVLGLPRGGVVVAAEVARVLDLPLDVVITRKIGAPFNPEYALGAVAEYGAVVLNDEEIAMLGIPPASIAAEVRAQQAEIDRRIQEYRGGRSLEYLRGRIAILVDDGIATGYTMLAAVRAAKRAGARKIIVAVPVAPAESLPRFQAVADSVVVVDTPEPFLAVGRFYEHFEQVTDAEVEQILARERAREAARRRSAS